MSVRMYVCLHVVYIDIHGDWPVFVLLRWLVQVAALLEPAQGGAAHEAGFL